jgi:hypothetical protein
MILFQVDGRYSLGSLLYYLSFSIILVGKLKSERKRMMEKRKINPKRRKGICFLVYLPST